MIRVLVPPGQLRPHVVLEVRDDEHAYLTRVRRVVCGDAVEVFDGEGQHARAVVTDIDGERALVLVGELGPALARGPHLTALIPLIKGDRMELCIEKLVEVGVDAVVTYEAARAVVKLAPAKVSERVRRWQAVAAAAARQAGRALTPTIEAPISLTAAIAGLPAGAALFAAHPAAELPIAWSLPQASHGVVLTGPEGGLSPDELDEALAAGFTLGSLGAHVLRAETAPLVAVAHLRLLARSATG